MDAKQIDFTFVSATRTINSSAAPDATSDDAVLDGCLQGLGAVAGLSVLRCTKLDYANGHRYSVTLGLWDEGTSRHVATEAGTLHIAPNAWIA